MTHNAHPRLSDSANAIDDNNANIDVDVLVVGAGPTGLTAAVEALRLGLSVRIIERLAVPGNFSKALVVHARTMEVFALMGVHREVLEHGVPFAALNLHFAQRKRHVRVDLLNQPWGDTDFPYWLSIPQCDTERVLESRLNHLGGTVEWSSSLRSLADRGEWVEVAVEKEQSTEIIRARWVVGCDGGRSTVRDHTDISLERTGARATFLLADLKITSDLVEDEGHLYLAPEGLLILVPMPQPRQWRVIVHVASTEGSMPPNIDAAAVNSLIRERTGIDSGVHDITWTSQFDLSHGVADRFRAGRVFLAGDAAHIHSPVGGQGLNTGVQDAHNLMWRLAESRHATPKAAEELLTAYESERRTSATAMVEGVARVTRIMTSTRSVARHLRGRVSPLIVSLPFVQAQLARGVGMLNLSYAKRYVSRRFAGIRAGQRLPNPALRDGTRLYDWINANGYSWVVLGGDAQSSEALDLSQQRWQGLPVFSVLRHDLAVSDRRSRKQVTLVVRPDRYVAAIGMDPESLMGAIPTRRAA